MAVVFLVAAACGSDADSGPTTSTEPDPASTVSSTAPAGNPAATTTPPTMAPPATQADEPLTQVLQTIDKRCLDLESFVDIAIDDARCSFGISDFIARGPEPFFWEFTVPAGGVSDVADVLVNFSGMDGSGVPFLLQCAGDGECRGFTDLGFLPVEFVEPVTVDGVDLEQGTWAMSGLVFTEDGGLTVKVPMATSSQGDVPGGNVTVSELTFETILENFRTTEAVKVDDSATWFGE